MVDLRWHEFETGDRLAESLASNVAERLSDAVDARGAASLAVSGGRTPGVFFDRLSRKEIAWDKVTVTLVDERFVSPDSERSNARLVVGKLLQNAAAEAAFVGLYSEVDDVAEAASRASEAIASLPLPLDVVMLGMGTDRHTASFFPDAANIGALLEDDNGSVVRPVQAASAGEPRLTLSLQKIATGRCVILHVEGEEKRAVLNEALALPAGPSNPVRTVLEASRTRPHIYWAKNA